MQILGFHIISDVELRKQMDEVRTIQRRLNSVIVSKLLYNAETFRKKYATFIRKLRKGGKI